MQNNEHFSIEIEEDVSLVDLISIEELTRVQEAFSNMARVATVVTDANGVPITQGSNFNPFCLACRATAEGRKRCEYCDKMGVISAFEQKKPVYYYCHAHMIDFAAPIMLGGKVIGGIVGGQVLASEVDAVAIRQTARELGLNDSDFLEAAREISIIPVQAVERCTNFIYEFAEMLSDIAYHTYVAREEGEAALKAASAKTDFLANMSHEIRTPMNAIIGMSQLALREEMSPKARANINQVLTSANMLLTIINDILDYSKLDAGKMSINVVEYEPLTLIKDVVGILSNRVGAKNLELTVDIDPDIPLVLKGDDIRIKQIIVNLANNAIKFTEAGQVAISVKKRRLPGKKVKLCVAVKDSGIGIKPEDMDKLFNSFQQVDSKRNRKIEGTGLGLAIVKSLIEEMGGNIKVESEYGSGSTFSFEILQDIVKDTRSIRPLAECPVVIGYLENPYVKKQLEKDMILLGAQYMAVTREELSMVIEQGGVDYLFLEENCVTPEIIEKANEYSQENGLRVVVISSLESSRYSQEVSLTLLKKPVTIYSLSNVLQNISMETERLDAKEDVIDFEMPDIRVLIVDDNDVNLTVAEGLFEPFHMQLETANSGFKALEMIQGKQYDIIFMDHMMPEMDGIETSHMIREHGEHYKKVPIIALTANAIAGSREMYLKEGLNDFLAKPIQISEVISILKKWVPEEKRMFMQPAKLNTSNAKETGTGLDSITFLDTGYALGLLKSEKLFWKVLKDYYNMIDRKIEKIKKCEVSEDIGNYIVEVHALKSSSKQIGALSLSRKAEYLEKMGNMHEIGKIHELTDEMLSEYKNLHDALMPYLNEEEKEEVSEVAETVDVSALRETISAIRVAIDDLDMDKIDAFLGDRKNYRFKDVEYVEQLKQLLWDMDIDGFLVILDKWEASL